MNNDYYRIGWSPSENQVTISITSDNGHTMTLQLSPDECERMIRMIRAAYSEEIVYNKCIVCGDPKGHEGKSCNMFDTDGK